jgi:hypothetical protein
LNIGAMDAVLIANRHPNRRRLVGRLALALGTLLLVSGPVGIASGIFGQGDIGGELVDASQRARISLETISEFMNCVAFAVLAFGIPAVTAFVLFLRWRAKP